MAHKPSTWPRWDREDARRFVESRALRVHVLEDAVERELVRTMVAQVEARGGGGAPCQRT